MRRVDLEVSGVLYKQGDVAVVRSDLQAGKRYYSADMCSQEIVVDEMLKYAGKTVVIKSVHGRKYRLSGIDWNWVDGMFESCVEDDDWSEIVDTDISSFFSLN